MTTRGYVLMEVVIGGALAAAVLLGLLGQIADSRLKTTIAARDTTAAQLVRAQLEQTSAVGFGVAPGTTTEAQVAGVAGVFRRVTVVGAVANETIGSVSVPAQTVTVTVSYEPSTAGTRSVSSSITLYRP